MVSRVPRVAAVHDLSCVGRCSLTVIMPVLSAMGIQVCPLPTAILSSHLGGFQQMAFYDFTDRMPEFSSHWKTEGMTFDCIYSGFLASVRQIDVVKDFIREFSVNQPLVLVDPVMGDEGKLYSIYTQEMQNHMKNLVSQANVITPNYTEACFLLGEPYQERIEDLAVLRKWLVRLSEFGPSRIVMTGISDQDGQVVNLGYERESSEYFEVRGQFIKARYPGTGDVFASVLLGSLLQGKELGQAMQKAANFVSQAIQVTAAAETPTREGVLLERVLPCLWPGNDRCDGKE